MSSLQLVRKTTTSAVYLLPYSLTEELLSEMHRAASLANRMGDEYNDCAAHPHYNAFMAAMHDHFGDVTINIKCGKHSDNLYMMVAA